MLPETQPAPAQTLRRVLVEGGGVIGLATALELALRGHAVTVFERGVAGSGATWAAAGMLAANDAHHPPALVSFAQHSASLYPAFLLRVQALSGLPVPIQTRAVVEYTNGIAASPAPELSLDPRQLAPALFEAVRKAGVQVFEQAEVAAVHEDHNGIQVTLANGSQHAADALVRTAGAWTAHPAISPRKGQMLRVQLPPALRALDQVHRSGDVYIVPRTHGPQAGSALLGATVEDAGFDTTTHQCALDRLRQLAAQLLPAFADPAAAPQLEAWAGLRPTTPDGLPLLGFSPHSRRILFNTGHFRNGILLAPASAEAVADIIERGNTPANLAAFSPARF
jgi:glycine oxidase